MFKDCLKRIVSRHLKQAKQMNLLTNYDDTLLAMAELEGIGWLERAFRDTDEQSVNYALKQIKRVNKEIEEDKEELAQETDPKEIPYLEKWLKEKQEQNISNVVIYGFGGFHRYFVKPDGSVEFSKGHALLEDTEKARDLGFTIWG